MQEMREGAGQVNLFEQAKHLPDGARNITDWLGSGGQVVDPRTAQHRANTCLTCALNQPISNITKAVALAIRAQLGVKNKLKLRVDGEKRLQGCAACGCVLRLQVWEPQDRVESHLTEEEIQKIPSFCWKIKKQ
jgi:hypothetical protein